MRDTLTRVAELAEQAVPHAAMVGLTMPVEGQLATAVFTDPLSPTLDAVQYQAGRGPCLDAVRERRVVRVDSTPDDDHWPEFTDEAAKHGILSTLSLPMVAADRGVGAMNLYARRVSAFSEKDEETGIAFAAQGAIVIANADAYWTAHALSETLNEAMQSRAVIEQAKGVLMEQSGVSADAAFDLLRRASQRENRKLRDIAGEIVERAQHARSD